MPVTTRAATARLAAAREARGPMSFGGPRPPNVPHDYSYSFMPRRSIPVEATEDLSEQTNIGLEWFEHYLRHGIPAQEAPMATIGLQQEVDEPEQEPEMDEDKPNNLNVARYVVSNGVRQFSVKIEPVDINMYKKEETPEPAKTKKEETPGYTKIEDGFTGSETHIKAEFPDLIKRESVEGPKSMKMEEDDPIWPGCLSEAKPTKAVELQLEDCTESIKMEDIPVWPGSGGKQTSSTPEFKVKRRRSEDFEATPCHEIKKERGLCLTAQ